MDRRGTPYAQDREANLRDLQSRLIAGTYRARQRPIGIPVLEDKLVQRATVEVLSAVYEQDFLGFTHSCARTRKGSFVVVRRTMAKRLRAKLKQIKDELRRRMHEPVNAVGGWLASVLRGYYRYYGVPRNYAALDRLRDLVRRTWRRALSRRSQRGSITEAVMTPLARAWLPRPAIGQPYPEDRLRGMIRGKSPVR